MIKDTQKRIEAYKAALPNLKERIVAVALLLAISLSMVISVSFAWITLSRAPEIAGVNTTVAANGNLEIALASPNGESPWESKVGDSSAAEGNTVTNANITWGNLVNLSDPSYGLSNIVLRPALLSNASNLLSQPLKGAEYGEDGRVELYYNEDFQFTNWVEPSNGVDGYFKYNAIPQYGVRAISTVEYTYVNNTYYQFTQLMKVATGLQETVKADYNSDKLIGNKNYINALAGLIGDFMTDKLNDSDTDVSGYMEDVYNMMCAFEEIVYDFGDVLVALANVQVYNKYGPDDYSTYTYTRETFFASTASELKANGVVIDSLDDYLTIVNKLEKVMYGTDPNTDDCIKDFYDRVAADRSAQVKLSELLPYVNELVHINTCQILLADGTTYTVGSLGMSAATQLLGKDIDAKITKGILKDFEQLSGCKMLATNVVVKATYLITVKMTAKTITTSAADPYLFDTDVETTTAVAAENKGDYTAVAKDTYGMAIDLWVRTNAADSYLTLEGNVLTKTETVRETGVDMNGNKVELYTVTITTSYTADDGTTEPVSSEVAVYKITTDGTDVWYNANNHTKIYNDDGTAPEGQTISTPMERYKEVVTVIGYEGENRIWDTESNIFLNTDSTTQGSGSCYVFYAEDPAQQENCLRLLSNLRIAFIDSNESSPTYGKAVAMAKLDIEHRYEENGKVTIPLVLTDDGSSYLTKTEDGLAIMELEQNVAARLTAVVYLDGREISNSDVLAANDIQGQLNIQFGSSVKMNAMSDEALEEATRSVSAVASTTEGSFAGTNSLIEFDYDDNTPMTVHVKLTVNGEQPTNATAFFMRKVNSTQGSRMDTFKLTKGADGCWYGTYTFASPGEYVLRTVQLDGVDYDLPSTDYPQVKIAGFAINSVSVVYNSYDITERAYTIMTGDRAVNTNLSLKFSSDQKKLPSSVRLQFLKDDGSQVTATMSYDAANDKWNGAASFTSSGVYTLKYVILDGEYTELDAKFQRELTIYSGMTVRVTDTGEFRDTTYTGQAMTVPVYVDIYDNTGEKIKYLSGAKLVYTRSGSNVDGMNPDLKWDDTEGCYTGNLQISGPGIYIFNAVTVDGNVLKTITAATPVYTCVSPEPPSYVDAEPMAGLDYELSTGTNTIRVGVRVANAEAATVIAVLYDADTGNYAEKTATASGKTVYDEEGNPISEFVVELPRNSAGYQSGDWTVTSLKLANVYDADSKFYGENNPMIMDLTNSTDDLHVKVVNIKVKLTGESETFENKAFLEKATTQGNITVTITDQNDVALDSKYISISDVNCVYKYQTNSSVSCGGYASNSVEDQEEILLGYTINGQTYTMNTFTLTYAGIYEGGLTFTVSETAEDGDSEIVKYTAASLPVYTLKTVKPTAKITAVSPSTAINTRLTWKTNILGTPTFTASESKTNSYSNYAATLYASATVDNSTLGNRHGFLAEPRLTITVDNVPTGCTASLTLPAGNASAVTFVRDGSGDISKEIGMTSTIKYFGAGNRHYLEGYTGHGNVSITTMTLTKNGVTYTVTLDNPLAITNPSSTNQTS